MRSRGWSNHEEAIKLTQREVGSDEAAGPVASEGFEQADYRVEPLDLDGSLVPAVQVIPARQAGSQAPTRGSRR